MENRPIKSIVRKILTEHISKKEKINEASGPLDAISELILKLRTSYGDELANIFTNLVMKDMKTNIRVDLKTKQVFLKSLRSIEDIPLSQVEDAIDLIASGDIPLDEAARQLPRQLKDGTEFRSILVRGVNEIKSKQKPKPNVSEPNVSNSIRNISNDISEDIFNYRIVTQEDAIDYLTSKIKSLKLSRIPKGRERDFVKELAAQVNTRTKIFNAIEKVDTLVKELDKLPLSEQKEVIKLTMDEIKKAYPSVWKRIRNIYGKDMFTKEAYVWSLKISGYFSVTTIALDVIRLIWGEGEWKGHLGMNLGQTLTVKVASVAIPFANIFLNVILFTESTIRTIHSTFIADKEESKLDKAKRKAEEKGKEYLDKGKKLLKKGEEKGEKLLNKGKGMVNKNIPPVVNKKNSNGPV